MKPKVEIKGEFVKPEIGKVVVLCDGTSARVDEVVGDVVRGRHLVREGVALRFFASRDVWLDHQRGIIRLDWRR